MWTERLIAELCDLKAVGVPFEQAWRVALERHPPMRRDLGDVRPCLWDDEPSVVEFLRGACDDAWHGRCAVLRHLPLALDVSAGWDASPAVVQQRRRGL